MGGKGEGGESPREVAGCGEANKRERGGGEGEGGGRGRGGGGVQGARVRPRGKGVKVLGECVWSGALDNDPPLIRASNTHGGMCLVIWWYCA